MSAPAPFEFYVNKQGTATLLAYIEDDDGDPITQAAISSITYTISAVDEHDPDDDATTVSGHTSASLTVASVVFDTEQKTDARWDVTDHDGKGYNFLHTLDISTNQAFANRGTRWRIRVKFTPASGQVFWAEYIAAVR